MILPWLSSVCRSSLTVAARLARVTVPAARGCSCRDVIGDATAADDAMAIIILLTLVVGIPTLIAIWLTYWFCIKRP